MAGPAADGTRAGSVRPSAALPPSISPITSPTTNARPASRMVTESSHSSFMRFSFLNGRRVTRYLSSVRPGGRSRQVLPPVITLETAAFL